MWATWENIKLWTSSRIEFRILKKHKRQKRYFKWVTPLNITIVTDSNIIKPFPRKFSSLSWWSREIYLKGIKPWITNVKIMFWKNIVKTYKVRVYSKNEKIYLKSGMIYWKDKIAPWQRQKWIALFSDKTKKRLIWVKYSGVYKLKGIWDTKVCIKSWSSKYIARIYKRICRPEEYKNEITFSYDNTVSWILLFDYKSIWMNAKVEIINTYNNSILATKDLRVLASRNSNITYVR